MTVYDFLIAPFADYGFMRRALAGACILAVSAGPVGVFLMLRRMSLMGDAMAHAILPGAAVGFLFAGLAILPMTFGGLVAGLFVALLAGAVSRLTIQREDASLAAFYLISLALGVLLVSIKGSSVDLMHVLFGTVLALNNEALVLIGAIATITIASLVVIWRPLLAFGEPVRADRAFRLPDAGGAQPRRRFSGLGNAAGGWPDDASGARRPLLVPRP
jgi:zinc/manganese transport system permease protein